MNLPDNAVEMREVRLNFLDGLSEQPAVRSHTDVSHPVDGHQCLHQPAQRVERGLTRLAYKHDNTDSDIYTSVTPTKPAIKEVMLISWIQSESQAVPTLFKVL